MENPLVSVDKIEIITLEDNYIDITAGGNSEIIKRGRPASGSALSGSILAEHGFSAVVRISGRATHTLMIDFGLSEDVADRNATTLGLDLKQVEAAVLSHGHRDHFGGIERVGKSIGKKDLPLVVHPSVFKPNRFIRMAPGLKMPMASADPERIQQAGFKVIPSANPLCLLEDQVLFLGEIPRKTRFEKGMPNAFSEKEGEEIPDILEDDTAVVMNLKEKGLVIISGCAHSGIINTIEYAREVTGISKVHAVMGGFHLAGPVFESIIDETVDALQQINPAYIVPTHCTGRKAVSAIETRMPEAFILNMAGTSLTFAA